MLRRFMMNRWGYRSTNRWGSRSAMPWRRGRFLTFSHSATVIVVSLAVILILYLLGYIAL